MRCLTLLILLVVENVLSDFRVKNDAKHTTETKYILRSVNTSENNFVGNLTETTLPVPLSISRILDFYNVELLAANWNRIKQNVSEVCQNDVKIYIVALSKGDSWALKMDDASGRYSTGWFWGNGYWVGSQTMCEHITSKKGIVINQQVFSNRTVRAAEVPLKTTKIPTSLDHTPQPISVSNGPPFPISFYILRLHLNSSLINEKFVDVGLCMPHACKEGDIQNIMKKTSALSTKVTVKVKSVKLGQNKYNMWADTTFLILCTTTIVTVLLLIVGTSFDYYLEHKKTAELRAKNCAHYNATLEMHMPDLKTENGKNISTNNSYRSNDEYLKTIESCNADKNSSRSHQSIRGLVIKEMILSFSVRANLNIICDQNVGTDTLRVVHGLKVISMAWIILGHTCIVAMSYADNMEYRTVIQKEIIFQTIINTSFSVDTFFFTSGLLVTFLYFRSNAKGTLRPLNKGNNFTSGFLHFLGLITYRFLRLTLPYLVSIGVVEVIMKWFHYNSVFTPPMQDHTNCPKYWWRNILYINTLFPQNQMCMFWSWYLSDDTQFYVLGAIMLILATSRFKTAAGLLLTFLISSWMTTGYITYSNNHVPNSNDPFALFDKIYDKPWTRLGPYLIGMCTGWYLYKQNCLAHITKVTLIMGWMTAIGILLALVYGLFEVRLDPWIGAAYSSLSHSAWALSLAWIVIACTTGYGGLVNKILSSTILYPLSRITYCAYLLHPVVIRLMMMLMDGPLHLGSIIVLIIFLGQFVASYIAALLFSLTFEAPAVSMLRIITKVIAARKEQSRNVPA